ncbi:MAG: hypothetical protein RL885_11850 [Planctomycetota bacterium]
MSQWTKRAALFAALLIVATPAVAQQINEIRIDQPSTDNDEYFELFGTPNQALDGLTYVVIGDGSTASGTIEEAIDLTGLALDANGYFVAAEGSFTLGVADFTTSLNFENSDNVTHMLVTGFTGANGQDLDTNDDCVLDVTPWASIVDSIALVEEANPPTGTECFYGTGIGPESNQGGTFIPGQIYRCGNRWFMGLFDPASGTDTPGAANADLNMNLLGTPSTGNSVSFQICAQGQDGNTAQVLLSCSGTAGIVLPGSGGLTLPLTFDACTALSLNLAVALRGTVGATDSGVADTPSLPVPATGGPVSAWAAAFTTSGASFVSVTSAIDFTIN